ncbi:ArsR family transcriptional regulator [Amycolatopsis mediterranei S699]|uniref:ArsR family transcriptional regulator n=2 Tax=Amycolatopsis mediterranei TaxID=33910 RepID=A0A0H3D386_AMYMU|nr:ArsR family transcriptional regulator [Amycolatopsis mediterranei]ADJ45110.1 ArsR family transcriptional regulator [Amycolatopsis mediterranei U32]AEK41866.1 ArsR family transcriptional regulator [Amycolatopsis mediterranei S699]AFO76821.1 ArsR family transcriptional regulator [Amycolatopsis mediterranei S699]AGT83949.1 ArsR family transcriptional regulator [Amycolatopsis mediterranei RB]KDO08750.1 ArsR family transcriptional regulator [Amycolatopsis mediterranei]
MASEPPAFVRLAAHPLRWALLTALAGGDLRVRELVERVGEPQNLVSYHLRLLRGGGLVTAARSSFDGRDSYYHLDLDRCAGALAEAGAALHPTLDPAPRPQVPPPRPVAVLFLCTGNSARSPIAEALLRRRAAGAVTVTSAGSHPKAALHPGAIRALEEFGIDVRGQRPRHLDTVAGQRFDHVITVCDKVREVCPEFPHHPRRRHWSIPEPGSFPETAAELDTRVRHLLPELVPGKEVRP